jgi:hypothetical protein
MSGRRKQLRQFRIAIRAEPDGQLDPQSLAVQSVGMLIGRPFSIAGKLPFSFGRRSMMRRTASEIRELVCGGRWKRSHLLAVQREFGDQLLFDSLFGVFTEARTYPEQQIAGRHLLELQPACSVALEQAIRLSLPNWNLSVEEVPFYFCRVFGRDSVLEALDAIDRGVDLSETDRNSIQTYRFWLRHLPGADLRD